MNTLDIIDYIVNWMDRYIKTSSLNGFVVGVSGGIDSAVTSTLCAITGKSVMALNMPIHQEKDQVSRSEQHIAWLKANYKNVSSRTVDLTHAFESIRLTLPGEVQDGLTLANTRSRLRMLTLYAYAGHYRMLVAGTGNKVEDFGVGFYTKYGDGGVDISPIADLMKSQVYEIGRSLNIIDDILTAPPTDGLWDDNRTDENQIGATYSELEWAMKFMAMPKNARPKPDVRQQEVLRIYQKFHTANRHKMDPIPVCLLPDDLKA